MSKKSRRARAKYRTSDKSAKREPMERAQAPKSAFEPKVAASLVLPSSAPTQVARYQNVLSDLRRIGIIAGALFLTLIVLTFVLR